MKKKLIIIFTYKYPYEPPVEQFLDMEVSYLAGKESDIIILPIARKINKDLKYDLKDSKYYDIADLKRKGKIIELIIGIKGLLSTDFFKDVIAVAKKDRSHLLLRWKDTINCYIQSYVIKKYIADIINSVNKENYDKIILYSYWLDVTAVALARFIKQTRLKNVIAISRAHGQGDLYDTEYHTNYRPGQSLLNNKLDKIYSISNDGEIYLNSQGIFNVKVDRLGVPKQHWKLDYQCQQQKKVIVSCSVINDNKRVTDIANCISRISDIQVNWIHFGGGEGEENLVEWCENNMPSNITWRINGVTPHNTIMDYYRNNQVDVFINLSKVEGIPVSIMEAFSFGIPCIATDVGATSEIVKTNINGVLLQADYTIKDVTCCLVKMITLSENEQIVFKENAYNMWDEEYNSRKNFMSFANNISK